jgi:predicted peptidase
VARKTAVKTAPASFVRRDVVVDGVRYPYQVFLPQAQAGRKPPVILFLHGSGERGRDGFLQTTVGLGPEVTRRSADFPAIVVMPQAPPDSVWAGPPAQAAILALENALTEFSGDPDRLYLTGVSMGAYGALEIALLNPGRFAALVPICGGLRPIAAHPGIAVRGVAGVLGDVYADAASRLARIPTWIFHGSADRVVPVEGSRLMAAALRNAGAEVHYTEYAGVGHNSWSRAYAEPELWTWLFAQRRTDR